MSDGEVEVRIKPNRGGQYEFMRLSSTYQAAIGGIGSGKTFIGAAKAVIYALEHPKSTGMVVAPTYTMLQTVTMPTFVEAVPHEAIRSYKGSPLFIMTLKNEALIFFRSADNAENLRGANLNWFWIDEGALVKEAAWLIMIGRIRKSNALGMITTTPKGRNWIWRRFVEARDASYQMARMPTAENQKHLRAGFIEELGYTGSYAAQELEGEFVTFDGLVYQNFSRDKHLFNAAELADWLQVGKFQRYIAGVDWGFTNPGVILPHGFDGDGRAYLLEEHYQRRLPVVSDDPDADSWVKKAQEIASRYPGIEFACDPSEPAFIEAFRSKGLNAYGAINDIQPGISALYSRLDSYANNAYGWQGIDSAANTISEFEIYHYADPNAGKSGNEKPVKEGDHAMDAARYAVAQVDLTAAVPDLVGAIDIASWGSLWGATNGR